MQGGHPCRPVCGGPYHEESDNVGIAHVDALGNVDSGSIVAAQSQEQPAVISAFERLLNRLLPDIVTKEVPLANTLIRQSLLSLVAHAAMLGKKGGLQGTRRQTHVHGHDVRSVPSEYPR